MTLLTCPKIESMNGEKKEVVLRFGWYRSEQGTLLRALATGV